MSFHTDLLTQARSLVTREPRRPRQASLRRAVSSAYYALFHLLVHEASRFVTGPNAELRHLVGRAFVHGEMNKASKSFSGGSLPRKYDAVSKGRAVPAQLRDVAQAFVDLQQARHDADYNLAMSLTRSEARDLVDRTEQAFQDWHSVREHELARLYLMCLLLHDRWDKVK